MRERKEISREKDAEKLLAFLQERPNKAMPYSDETPADLIIKRFQISKSAFKRALGKLMKEGLVYQEGNWTYLRKPEEIRDETEQLSPHKTGQDSDSRQKERNS
jgi:hypothetical protein